ncbi:MAG: glutathione S-transferase N-terminal domain-containing protein [Myxococcales bacterium]|nr:glutathione S-transferase N-terminal domain-containing protein [Myxococcales bacterium]MCB9545187.1 glutathione S-transferase N-terminal domain-containing protein [Myxococcales bacterium]
MAAIRVYSTRTCFYCMAARRLLHRLGLDFEEIDVTGDDATRHWLVEASGQRTVPQIFFGDTSIGGYTDLVRLERAGELPRLLAEG